MRSLLKFFLILILILFASALLAPYLYDYLPFKFERIFNRLVMIFTLTAIVIAVRRNPKNFQGLGMQWNKNSLLFSGIGFAGGVSMVLAALVLKGFFGVAQWSPMEFSFAQIMLKILGALAAASLIAVIEEFFFRGVIFTHLNKMLNHRFLLAILITSLFYSLIHFIDSDLPYIGPNPTLLDSFKLILTPLNSLLRIDRYWAGALGLFIFGIILNVLVLRTKSLYPAIGLHAGCVFLLKLDGTFVDTLGNRGIVFGTNQIYDGLIGWVCLILLGIILFNLKPFQKAKLALIAFLALGLTLSNGTVKAAEEDEFLESFQASYLSFVDMLKDAETYILLKNKDRIVGKWEDGYFAFTDVDQRMTIKAENQVIDGVEAAVIRFSPYEQGLRRLKYYQVKPGDKMKLKYGIDSPLEPQKGRFVYFRVWAGQQIIKRFRIPIERKWSEQTFDTGIGAFLDREIDFTFDIYSDNVPGIVFSFSAETY